MTDHPLSGRKQNPEHVAKKARKCAPGCVCGRHKVNTSPEARERQSQRSKQMWTDGTYAEKGAKFSAAWAAKTPEELAEFSRKQSEARKAEWAQAKAEGRRRNTRFGTKRASKHELALIPYLEAQGYLHNRTLRVGRKVPDFVDQVNRRVFEYFGTYWHPRPEEEQETVEHYALLGWDCTVLWETDLFEWLAAHEHLVTSEQHQAAWKAAHVNNGYLKPASNV